jgi:excisionase family DNA binding protein
MGVSMRNKSQAKVIEFPLQSIAAEQVSSRLPIAAIIVFESPRLYLTVDEAARYLRISRRTLYTLMKKKQITFSRVREGVRFRLQWLNDYIDKRTVNAA